MGGQQGVHTAASANQKHIGIEDTRAQWAGQHTGKVDARHSAAAMDHFQWQTNQ